MHAWTITLLVGSISLGAQPSDKVSYEGQEVAAVELVANPKISIDAYRSLVQQKSGEPYSDSKVQNTVGALEKTGQFTKIELTVQPDPGGLRLTFTLEPALYFGMFEFPGATKAFSYTQLLQVVDIPPETAYKNDLVATSGGALLKFFIANGYFQAQVRSETHFDEVHMLANVTFHVDLGKPAKIGNIIVRGGSPAERNRLVHDTRTLYATLAGKSLKPGQNYTPKRIKNGITLMKRDLAHQHRLANRVRFDEAQYHPDTNHADIWIDADVGPIVNVGIRGARLTWIPFMEGRKMRDLIPIFSEGAIDPDLVEEGRRDLIDLFQNKGYFDVQVRTNFQTQPGRVNVVYSIDKGHKHSVVAIGFRGNHHFDADDLREDISIKPRRFLLSRGKFSDKLIGESKKSLTTFYKNHGFEDVQVDADIVDREPKIYVTFLVTEGAQTLVDDLVLRGNFKLAGWELAPRGGFNLRPGQPFSPLGLSKDRAQVTAAYLGRGYLNANFDSQVNRLPDNPHKVEVIYTIKENQQVDVNQVLYMGDRDTRRSLTQKTAHVVTESPLSEETLLQSESNLYDLGVFEWATVGPRRPITDQNREDVLVKLHEGRKNSLSYGFGLQIARRGGNLPSGTIALPGLPPVAIGNEKKFTFAEKTFVSPRGSIEYTRNNVRGLAETLDLSLLVSRLDQRAVASYTIPHFRLSGWKSLFSASAERTTQNPIFAAKLGDGTWQLEKPLNKQGSRRIQLRYQFRRTILSNLAIPGLVEPQDQSLRLSTVSATWIRDTRDKPLDARNGFYQTLDLGITPSALGSNTNFARFLGQSSYYKSLGNMVWANRIMLGVSKAFAGDHVPTSERFFSGGETTLRGFFINGAGPQRTVPACVRPTDPTSCTNIRVPVGGHQLFIFNSEIRFPLGILKSLGGALFYDGGNVYGPIGVSRFIRDYTNTVGIGLRYSTPVGPVRFDIGRNLNPVTGMRATQFFITLGQAF